MRGLYAGAVAGTFGLTLSVPVELLKNRAQMNKDGNLSTSKELKVIIRQDGFLGLYRGFWAMAIREIPGCAIYFGAYAYLK